MIGVDGSARAELEVDLARPPAHGSPLLVGEEPLLVPETLPLPDPIVVAARRIELVRDADGSVRLTSEALPPHAEVDTARVDRKASTLDLAGRAPETAPARVNARRRGDGEVVGFDATVDGERFSAQIDLGALAVGVWDLYLGPELRLATHLDGILNRKAVAPFPALQVADRVVRPSYTRDNELSVHVEPGTVAAAAPGEEVTPVSLRRRLLGPVAVRLHRAAIGLAAFALRRRSGARRPGPVRVLLVHAYGIGGTIHTSINIAGGLRATHDVELVSLVRRKEQPSFRIPTGVALEAVHDVRPRR
ncbi:MAG: hypothetical protein QOI80_2623, partial [Solirubrobacteraceae bacterium]|nr:hypothetical protein [Solirubrobacteraceae bacterium]